MIDREKEYYMKMDKIKNKLTNPASRRTLWDLGIILLIVTVAVLTAYSVNGIYPFGSQSIARRFLRGCIMYGMSFMEKQIRFLHGIPVWA